MSDGIICENVRKLDGNFEGEPISKKMKSTIVSEHVESADFQKKFLEHWHGLKPVKTNTIEIITEPYRICKISNFLANDSFVSEIKEELKDIESSKNSMDLYQFEQTEDFANVKSKSIAKFYKYFQSDLVNWMKKNTGIELSGKISMSSASYSDTDYLLCHDDNLGDRRIAFILYLTKNWTAEDGGALDIFDTDANGQPKSIVRSLIPEYNSLVFFEVVDNSYHQVAEITSPDKLRISINGWFHGPLKDGGKKRKVEIVNSQYFEPEETDVDLVSLLSKIYLYETIVKKIQRTIEKDSFIYLPDFLLQERYEKLSHEIKSEEIKWEKTGPADLRNYEIAKEDSLPQTMKEFYNTFKSIHIFHLLKQYTELDLVPETSEMKPKMKIELQRWSPGCYMLINDKETFKSVKDSEKRMQRNENTKTDEFLKSETDAEPHENNTEKNTVKSVITNNEETIFNENGEEVEPQKKIIENSSRNEMESKCDTDKKKASPSKKAALSDSRNLPKKEFMPVVSNGSDSSGIEDYLSDSQSNSEDENSEIDREEKGAVPGTLDVLLQFNTENATEDTTIDYVNPSEKDGILIHIPPQDNHLCLVYRTGDTCRCNRYVNHYCKGYFYTLVCSYYE